MKLFDTNTVCIPLAVTKMSFEFKCKIRKVGTRIYQIKVSVSSNITLTFIIEFVPGSIQIIF
jgi:hypothetical protein